MGQAFITRRGGGGYSKKAMGITGSENTTVTVSGLGFTPKVVYISDMIPSFNMSTRMQMAYKDEETAIVYASDGSDQSSNASYAINITDDGFTWKIGYASGEELLWLALG